MGSHINKRNIRRFILYALLLGVAHLALSIISLYNGFIIFRSPSTPWEIFWQDAMEAMLFPADVLFRSAGGQWAQTLAIALNSLFWGCVFAAIIIMWRNRRARKILILTIAILAISPGMHSSAAARQVAERSYYALVRGAMDILIVRVERVEGRMYGQKAVAHIERSLKGVVHGDSIELPFLYTKYLNSRGLQEAISEYVPVAFEPGVRYVVFVTRWHRTHFNPNAAETEYAVVNYPDDTFFAVRDEQDPRLIEVERLLALAGVVNDDARGDSLLVLARSDRKKERVDAIEALRELGSEKAAGTFVAILRSDPDSTVRYFSARALGYPRASWVDTVLIGCLQSEKSKEVRYGIVGSLGRRKVKSAVPLLLNLYETEVYDVRNAILSAFPAMGDSTYVPRLLHLFSIDADWQHRHMIAGIVARYHTPDADEFSSALLDTSSSFSIKSAVIYGWAGTNYRKGFDRIARWTSVPCSYGKASPRARADMQALVFPLLRAVGMLGTPEQVASTLSVYASCDDDVIRQRAAGILKDQLSREISADLKTRIEEEIQSFHVN